MPQLPFWMKKRVPMASTASASFHSRWPTGMSTASRCELGTTPRPRR